VEEDGVKRAWVVLVVVSGALAATPSAFDSRTASSHFDLSWADSQHGWKICNGNLCASDDGGQTWRIVRNPAAATGLSAVVRTSATAGAIAGGPPQVPRYWTRDGGRTWQRTSAISGIFQGNSAYLFSLVGRSLVQARPWPPTGSGLKVRTVWTPPGGSQIDYPFANVPGGVATLVGYTGSPLRIGVLVYRLGQGRVTSLPQTGLPAGTDYFVNLGITADWPDLYVWAQAMQQSSPAPTPLGDAVWHSKDGGRTWLSGSTR
jgi:hypothetical protein